MIPWRRALTAALLVVTALTATTQSSLAQDAPVTAPGAEDVQPGQVVQSWALFPAGSDDPDQPGNRPNLTYNVPAGTSIDDAVTVANYGNVPLVLAIYAKDAFNNADGGFDILKSDEVNADAGGWVSIVQENIAVPPGEQYTIPVTITVPLDASPGDHVAAIVAAQTIPGTGPDGKTVTLEQRTGTRLYIRVDGELNPDLSVENLSTDYKSTWNPLSGTATVTYRIQNRGNVRLKGTQELTVGGVFGLLSTGETTDVPELLPGEGFDVTKTFDGVPATFISAANVEVVPAAVVEGSTTEELPTSSGSAVTVALPWLIIALLIIAALVWYTRRAYKRHQAGPPPGPAAAPPMPPTAPQAPMPQPPVGTPS